mgnify:FL=1
MGLFGRSYQKEGPGVSKDDVEKRKFFLFFELYFRKFWKLIKLNLLYFFVNIISVLSMAVIVVSIIAPHEKGTVDGIALIAYGVVILSGIIVGPSTAALVYVLRNYANQRHSFMASDFFEQFKKNFKQSVPVGLLTMVLPVVFTFAMRYYAGINTLWGTGLLCLTTFCVLVVLSAYLYVYPIMVTFDLKLKQILRNSLIMAFANFPVNILVLIISGAILYGVFMLPDMIAVTLMMVIVPVTIGFVSVFSIWGAIDRYMMPKNEDTEDEEESVFSDDRILK